MITGITRIRGKNYYTNNCVKIGLIADVHYAPWDDIYEPGNVYWRDRKNGYLKARDFVSDMNSNFIPDVVFSLGDAVASNGGMTTEYFKTVKDEFDKSNCNVYYAMGNHDAESSAERDIFLSMTGREKAYYSFDKNDLHFIVLDSLLNNDDSFSGKNAYHYSTLEIAWLQNDLANNTLPTFVIGHCRINDNTECDNASTIRTMLGNDNNVVAYFCGHSHMISRYYNNDVDQYGIWASCVDLYPNTAYASVTYNKATGDLRVDGSGYQKSFLNGVEIT